MHFISRRKFVALTATSVASAPLTSMARTLNGSVSAKGSVTAQEIFDRIRKNVGVEWKPDTVDTFKAGDSGTAVTGIVTTALASLNVLNAAVKAGANMIVTCEPTFFAKADSPTPPVRRIPGTPQNDVPSGPPPADPVFTAKAEFLKKHNLLVLRLSDHWHLRKPDPFAQGLATELGWSKFLAPAEPAHLTIPETSLDALASHVKKALQSRGGMRIVGNQTLRIRKVALLPGSTPLESAVKTLPDVDTIIAGEVREWETVEYVRDTVALGGKKSLILVGRVVSEDPGMQACAQWLKTIVPEVSSTWISAGDPYWRPML